MCCRTTQPTGWHNFSTSCHHETCPSATLCTLIVIQVLAHPHSLPDSEVVPGFPAQSSTTQTQSHQRNTAHILTLLDAFPHDLDLKGTCNSTPCVPLSRSVPSSTQIPPSPPSSFPTKPTSVPHALSSLP